MIWEPLLAQVPTICLHPLLGKCVIMLARAGAYSFSSRGLAKATSKRLNPKSMLDNCLSGSVFGFWAIGLPAAEGQADR